MALTGYMMYTMMVVLGVIALDILAGLYRSIVTNSFSFAKLANYLKSGILYSVVPLLVLAYMSGWSMWDWLLIAMYYVGALGIVIKYLMDIVKKLNS
jgi:hypothetical protein